MADTSRMSGSPFGDGKTGAAGNSSANAGHDFTKDPGSPPGGKGRDFTSESRPQQSTTPAQRACPDSIPAGGPLPLPKPGPSGGNPATTFPRDDGGKKPFK